MTARYAAWRQPATSILQARSGPAPLSQHSGPSTHQEAPSSDEWRSATARRKPHSRLPSPPPLQDSTGPINKPSTPPDYIVYISSTKRSSTSDLRKSLSSCIDPARDGIRIDKVLETSTGKLRLQLHSSLDYNRLITHPKLRASTLRLEPRTLNPRAILYNVPLTMSPPQLVDALWDQNQGLAQFISRHDLDSGILHSYLQKRRRVDAVDWIIEVTSTLRHALRFFDYLYLGWQRSKILDLIYIPRCFNCFSHGHVAKHCPTQYPFCGHCAFQDHPTETCPNRHLPQRCPPCFARDLPTTHDKDSADCPCYQEAFDGVLRRTNFG